MRYARIFWIGAAGILVLAALIGVSALLRSDFTETDGQVLLTLATLLLASGTAVAGLTLVDRGRLRAGTTVIVVAAVAFFVISASVWDGFDDETLAKAAGTTALVLIATLLVATLLVRFRGDLAVVVVIAGAALSFAALVSSTGIWEDGRDDNLWKVAGSLWIIGGVGWLLLPVLQRLADSSVSPAAAERLIAELDGVVLVATRSAEGLAVALRPGERLLLRRRGL
jgi:uncharacterized membrane protein YozB (DUF420 family)